MPHDSGGSNKSFDVTPQHSKDTAPQYRIVGRDTFLAQLHTTLREHRIVVVSGVSGIGKTTAVREYTHRFAQEYHAVLWLNAADDETFLADVISALQAYALPIDMKQGVPNLFQQLYTYISTQQNALLVLDNFSYEFLIDTSKLPTFLQVVIITQGQQTESPRLELKGLDGQNSAMLLAREAGLLSSQETSEQIEESQRQTIVELTRELHGVPIAIALAGRYLRMTGSTVYGYLSAFRDAPTPAHLLTDQYGSAMEDLAVVCERTLSYIQETDPVAFERLQMSVFLLPEAIPTLLFSSQTESEALDSEAEQVGKYSDILVDAGLLTAEQPFLRMHGLVQQTIRQSLSEEQQQRYIAQILRFFYQKLSVLQAETLPTRLCLADQIRHLASLSESESAFFDALIDVNEAGEVFAWASIIFAEVQLVTIAEPLLRRAVKICSHTLSEATPLVAISLTNLATMNKWLKNYEDAEMFAHRAIISKTDALGIAHPDVVLALRQLGQIYAEQGKRTEARQCYEKAVAIAKSVKLSNSPSGENE